MLSSLIPEMEIKEIYIAFTLTSTIERQFTGTEGISPEIILYFKSGSL